MKKIRILLVNDKFDYHGSYLNGPARYYSWLIQAIDDTAFDVVVCSLRARGQSDVLFHQIGIDVVYLDRSKFYPFVFVDLYRFVKARQIDVLHLTGYASTTFGRLAALLAGKPAIVHEHWVDPGFGGPIALIERCLNPFTARAIAVSDYARAFLIEKKGMPADKIVVIPNGIPLEVFQHASREDGLRMRDQFGFTPAQKIAGVVGMLHENKGHRYFMDAARALHADHPAARFVIVGDGELRSEYEAYIEQHGMDGYVRLLGHQEEMPAILQMLDVFVLSSLSETAPLSLLEAMAAGRAVVTTDCGGPSEWICDGENGAVVPVRDAGALAAAIGRCLVDADYAQRLATNARRDSAEHSMERTVRLVEALYRDVAG